MVKKFILIITLILSINISFANNNKTADDIRKQISEYAMTYLDTPYRWGSKGPSTFDCSGFVNYVYKKKANIDLPRSSYDIAKIGTAKFSNLEVADLLFFKTTSKARISHVGIYIGNNKFIHASSSKRGVVISELEGYYKKTFKWGVSVVNKKK